MSAPGLLSGGSLCLPVSRALLFFFFLSRFWTLSWRSDSKYGYCFSPPLLRARADAWLPSPGGQAGGPASSCSWESGSGWLVANGLRTGHNRLGAPSSLPPPPPPPHPSHLSSSSPSSPHHPSLLSRRLHGNPGTEVDQGALSIVVPHPKFISTHQAISAGLGGYTPTPTSSSSSCSCSIQFPLLRPEVFFQIKSKSSSYV